MMYPVRGVIGGLSCLVCPVRGMTGGAIMFDVSCERCDWWSYHV